jgi:outer membrane immunogenic protein
MRSISLAVMLFLGVAATAVAQAVPSVPAPSGDIAWTYHWVRTNTQPGDCGCFDLNGGGLSGSWNLPHRWAAVAEISGEYAGHGPTTGDTLSLASYLGGMRYRLPHPWPHGAHAPQPFLQGLLGVGHAGGGLAGAGDGTYAFVSRLGGGIDLPLRSGLALRVIQADYDLTNFANTVNDHQNNLLLGAGVVLRWSPRK